MARYPWTLAFLFAFGLIAWVLLAVPPIESSLRREVSRSLGADPDFRLISERSPYMRAER